MLLDPKNASPKSQKQKRRKDQDGEGCPGLGKHHG